MILADTSAWVEFDRSTGSAVDERLADLIEFDGPIAVTEPVSMEVLAGARSLKRELELRNLLQRFQLLSFDPAVDFHAAAHIYRSCRQVGITPRGLIDCIIASVAHRYGASLLAQDSDLSKVASVVGVELDHASSNGGPG